MRLFGVELARLASRRLFRWVLALFVAGVVLIGVLVMLNNEGSFLRSDLPGALLAFSFPLTMLGWLVGASSIGAEWGPRTMTSLLTWEPRRGLVLATKAAAAASFTAGLVVFLEILFTGVMLPAASASGLAGDSVLWEEYVGVGGRIALVAVIASLLGFGLAAIGKNTAAALGGGMAYLLIVETLVRSYKPGWGEWLLSTNIARVLEGGPGARSTTGAAVVLAAYAAALFVAALWVFRRREIA